MIRLPSRGRRVQGAFKDSANPAENVQLDGMVEEYCVGFKCPQSRELTMDLVEVSKLACVATFKAYFRSVSLMFSSDDHH